MTLVLYNNFSETNKLEKNIAKIIELVGTLREASSLINPSILIELNPSQLNNCIIEDNNTYVMYNNLKITWDSFIYNYVLSANYAYIPEFNRYYFINDITAIRTNIWRVNMHVDVLMSYSKEIKNTHAIVTRNEYKYNNFLLDDKISFSNKKEVTYLPITNSSDCKKFNSHLNDNELEPIVDNYVICALGINGTVSTYINDTPQESTLPKVTTDVMGNRAFNNYRVCSVAEVSYFLNEIFDDDTKKSFVKSVISFPYEVDKILGESEPTRTSITLGHTIVYCQVESEHLGGNYIPKHWAYERVKFADFTFLNKAESFKDLDPYTKYYLYCPYCDYIELPSVYLGDRIQVFYIVNYDDGNSKIIIYNYTKQIVIDNRQAQLGVRIAVSSTNQTELNNQKNALALNTAIGTMTSILTIVGGVVTENPLIVAGGVMSGVSTIGNAITTNAQLLPMGRVEISSGQNGLYLPQDFHLRIEKSVAISDDNYASIYGKPLYTYEKIGDMHGLTVVSDEHLDNFGSCTKSEHDEIKDILSSGFII